MSEAFPTADRKLVNDAVARHRAEAGRALAHTRPPGPAEMWPSVAFAQAQWHMLRADVLAALPVTAAAEILREETLRAVAPPKLTGAKITDGAVWAGFGGYLTGSDTWEISHERGFSARRSPGGGTTYGIPQDVVDAIRQAPRLPRRGEE